MKTILTALALAWSVTVHAQTYANYFFTSFVHTGNTFVASTNCIIPTNTIGKMLNMGGTMSVTNAFIIVQYPGQTLFTNFDPTSWINSPILGPCTVTLTGQASTSAGTFAVILAEFDTVNTTPQSTGFLVQPNGHQATVLLQTSTNLVAWTSITNGTFPATNRAAFYRINFTVQ